MTGTQTVSVENPDRNGSQVKRSNSYLTQTKDVTSAEYPLFYRALLHKRAVILRSLLIVATPYYIYAYQNFRLLYVHFFLYCSIYAYLSKRSSGETRYGVATISRLFKMIGLFCKRVLYKRLCSAKETLILRSPLIVGTPCD